MERNIHLLSLLSTQEYTPYKKLSDKLSVTSRTIYNDISTLNMMLKNHGARIESKAHFGLRLMIHDQKLYDDFFAIIKKEDALSSQGADTRVYIIIRKLINRKCFVKMDDLCDELFISRSTLKNDVKKIRTFITPFDLSIAYKPYEGIRLEGSEQNVRRCLAKTKRVIHELNGGFAYHEFEGIERILKAVFRNHDYNISEFAFHNLVVHLYIAISRIQTGSVLGESTIKIDDVDESVYVIAEEIMSELEKEYQIIFPKTEFAYISIHLESKKMMIASENTVVSSEIYEIVISMLKEINDTFSMDFRYDFELITLLSLHLAPLRVRLLHNLPFENPLMLQIREQFPLAYEMANVASRTMQNIYETNITGDEIAYIALHFNVAIERKRKKLKKNVMIVCGTGRGSAELLAYQVKETYGAYVNVVKTHQSIDFSDIDFHNIDYLLTTVQIQEAIPVPIIEIHTFMDHNQDEILKKFMNLEAKDRIIQYFSKDLFRSNIVLDRKEDVLKYLCSIASEHQVIADNFYDLVIEREKIGSTSFGNFIAIPHPRSLIGNESFVVTGILAQPINWDGEMVQIIFLLSMKEHGDDNLHGFYKMISNVLMNKAGVQEIIKNPTFDQLLRVIEKTTVL